MKKCVVAVMLLLFSMLLFQCYYIREGATLIDIYSGGEPIERALAGPDLPADEHNLLTLVQEIKHYATGRLGLRRNDNYSRYIRLQRDYLAEVVSACERLSFRQYTWHYLFVGELPYKGFFNPADAEQEKRLLLDAGYDVYLRRVDAFSTLGILSDPVFSFMKTYPAYALAELIFHEQTHATVFLSGQATFNENLATFVGEEAMRLFVREKYGPSSREYLIAEALDHDQRAFVSLMQTLSEDLQNVYAGKIPDYEKTRLKAETIEAWKKSFRNDYPHLFTTDLFKGFPDREINNALIMTYMNYREKQSAMRELFTLAGGDLPTFIRLARALPNGTKDPLAALKELILSASQEPAPAADSSAP